ncbi:MAG: 2-C-methyl-D-erythritol 4-phosphate cytidylyltransferase [Pirellulaceae bacterium]
MNTENRLPAKSIAVILPAAGKSRRFGGSESKIFATLAGHPVWWHSVQRLRQFAEVDQIILAINPDDRSRWEGEFAESIADLKIELVDGGDERYDSVRNAIQVVRDASLIAVHDAARPLTSEYDLRRLFEAVTQCDAIILATPVRGTIKRSDVDGCIQATVDRSDLWEAQTPQLFRREVLLRAYERWRGWPVTDDAGLVERAGGTVRVLEASPLNLKITTSDDLKLAEAILAFQASDSINAQRG